MDVKVIAGLSDLLCAFRMSFIPLPAVLIRFSQVLKSSGSAFENFIRDEFTTLVEVKDRILSTAVDLQYEFPKYTLENGLDSISTMEAELCLEKAAQLARNVTIDLFATHESGSVQVCTCVCLPRARVPLPSTHTPATNGGAYFIDKA